MVASDEAWYDDGPAVSRPMTITELCRRGPLKGIMTDQLYERRTLASYYHRVWGAVLGAMIVGATLTFRDLTVATLTFAGLSLGALVVGSMMAAHRNLQMFVALDRLRDDPLAIEATPRDIHLLTNDPVPGQIIMFRYGMARTPLPTINLSDGCGNQIVFVRFDDDHDRVMFRLAA